MFIYSSYTPVQQIEWVEIRRQIQTALVAPLVVTLRDVRIRRVRRVEVLGRIPSKVVWRRVVAPIALVSPSLSLWWSVPVVVGLSPALVIGWLSPIGVVSRWSLLWPALVVIPLVGLVVGLLSFVAGVVELQSLFWDHGLSLRLVMSIGNSIDFGVVVVELIELNGSGAVLID